MFEGNPDVAFADINLKEAPMIKGDEIGSPGKGGWPTIRYFNQKTGMYGDAYKKVTNKPMCEELGDRMTMIDYVEHYSGSVLCGIDGRNCNEKEEKYLGKWKEKPLDELKSQLTRLEDMTSKPMKDELLEWAWRRMRILMKLIDAAEESSGAEL
mmetsp:Transcript_30300/g.87376  ORF Transcript_30300/g.87376 Transcript_30300/m.87376 type:complete len:154 (-) Transcript_30300:192-653(-)